jgi:hypothetical protein
MQDGLMQGKRTLGGPWKIVASVLSASGLVLMIGISNSTLSPQAKPVEVRGMRVCRGIETRILRSFGSHLLIFRWMKWRMRPNSGLFSKFSG